MCELPNKLMTRNYLKNYPATYGSLELNILVNKLDFLHFGIKHKLYYLHLVASLKKTQKTPNSEIERAEWIGENYFKEKNKKDK